MIWEVKMAGMTLTTQPFSDDWFIKTEFAPTPIATALYH